MNLARNGVTLTRRSAWRRLISHNGVRRSSSTGGNDLRRRLHDEAQTELENARLHFVHSLPSASGEPRHETRRRAQNEWRWIVEAAVERHRAGEGVEAVVRDLRAMAARAVDKHEPLAYILGSQPFGPLSIKCRPPTLIPRTETEALAEHVAGLIVGRLRGKDLGARPAMRILDLCCGTACISLLLRYRILQYMRKSNVSIAAEIAAVDFSPSAVQLAEENCDTESKTELQEGLNGPSVKITVHLADLFSDTAMRKLISAHGPFDVLVCNPPYIPHRHWLALDDSVRLWEDKQALVGDVQAAGSDGLDFYRRIAQMLSSQGVLNQNGHGRPALIALETGHEQASDVREMMQQACLSAQVDVWNDQFGVQRAVLVDLKHPS